MKCFAYYGKTWIYWAQAVVFGGLAMFAMINGPLFLFGLAKDALGQPATDAGIALCIISIPLLIVFSLAAYNLWVRSRPILRICREGIEVQMIGESSLAGVPLIPAPLRLVWHILSGEGFRRRMLYIPWRSFQSVGIAGMPLSRSLILQWDVYASHTPDLPPLAGSLGLHEVQFDDPLDEIARAIQYEFEVPDPRDHLPSWFSRQVN